MNEEQEKKKETFRDKVRNTSLKSRILLIILVIGVAFIVFSAIVNLTISPDTFTDETKRNEWITKTAITMCVTVFGVIIGEQMSDDTLKRRSGGLYQTALIRFKQQRLSALKKNEFYGDWFIWFKAEQLRQKQKNYLIELGMEDAEIIMSHIEEIDFDGLLEHPQKFKDGKIIRRKEQWQIDAIQYVKKGGIKLSTYSPNYYMQESDETGSSYLLETAPELEKLQKSDITFSRAFKIGGGLIWSVFFGMLTADDFMNASDVQAWFNLIGRILSLITAFGSGWMTATRSVARKAQILDDKVDVLLSFESDINTRRFVPQTYEEKARKEEEEYEQNKLNSETDERSTCVPEKCESSVNSRQSECAEMVSNGNQEVSVEAK